MLAIALAGCGGDSSGSDRNGSDSAVYSPEYLQMVTALQLVYVGLSFERDGLGFLRMEPFALVLESEDCPIAGSAQLHDDGRVEFIECELSPDGSNGAMLGNEGLRPGPHAAQSAGIHA
jgi:hypothetical protein